VPVTRTVAGQLGKPESRTRTVTTVELEPQANLEHAASDRDRAGLVTVGTQLAMSKPTKSPPEGRAACPVMMMIIMIAWPRSSSAASLSDSAASETVIPLSCPQAAPPRRGGAIRVGRSSIVAALEGKSQVYCAFPLISCQPRLGTVTRPGGLGETQAVTVTARRRCAGAPPPAGRRATLAGRAAKPPY
jgi:hypothetical protein